MTKPTTLPIWDTDETNSIEPDSAHKIDGWLSPGGLPEKPPFQTFNFWQNAVWKWLNEINIKGILGYDALTDYIADLSYVVGNDGNRYHCKINNGPSSSTANPVGDITGTWEQILENIISKNAIINGAMLHAQRGASGSALFDSTTTPANSDDTYLIDRYINLSDGDDVVDVSQNTDAPVGSLLSCALDVEAINLKFGMLQIIEQKNCQHMIGGNVSLSFEAKVSDIAKLNNIKAMVVSWAGAVDAPTSDIISAWNAEDVTPTLVANWTVENTPANLGVTASWAKYKIENIAIDTAATKNIGVFIWSDGFCDTLGNILRITNIQLEKNPIVTEFDWWNVTNELVACQRYYCKSYSQNIAIGTATINGETHIRIDSVANADHIVGLTSRFVTTMRDIPAITSYDNDGALGKCKMAIGSVDSTIAKESNLGFYLSGTNGAADVDRILSYQFTADAEIGV